jgi:predicted O-methyltransferase YrrM
MKLNSYFITINEIIRQTFFAKSDYDFICTFTSTTHKNFKVIKKDLYEDINFISSIEKKYYQIRGKKLSLLKYEEWNRLLYYLIRLMKPEIIVETGVFDGMTTSFLLKALKENNMGHLYSIDLPAYETIKGSTHKMRFTTLPAACDVGWVIPSDLKDRWTLYKGSSRDHLKPLLDKLGHTDFFLHDSLHTYENMLYEYETAWPYIDEGGILASDDILWNSAFYEFAGKIKRDYLSKYHFGILKK